MVLRLHQHSIGYTGDGVEHGRSLAMTLSSQGSKTFFMTVSERSRNKLISNFYNLKEYIEKMFTKFWERRLI